jgi:uncharacterized protein (DUF1684 family)
MARMVPIEIANPANAPYHIIDKTIEFDNVNQEIELKLPTLNNIQEGNLINVPVRVLSANYLLGSMQFGVWYDQSLLEFKGIERFPVDAKWRIKAKVIPQHQNPLMIMNVLGQNTAQKHGGQLVFEIEGKTYQLDAIDEGGVRLFITFADATSGKTTYGSGRFIELEKPDADGYTYIDFNKAYNPPCAFTAFATCPLPPPQNRLSIAIPAGEKKYGHH